MATTNSQIDAVAGLTSSPYDQEPLLPGTVAEAVQAATDPLILPDLTQASIDLPPDQASSSGLSWELLDAAVASLNGPNGTASEAPAGLDVPNDAPLVNLDQLTGLVVADEPFQLPSSLVEGNLPPLLGDAVQADSLLVQRASADGPLVPLSWEVPLSAAPADYQFSLQEDQTFSLALADLFPLDAQLVDVRLQAISAAGSDWLDVEQRRPDESLIERLLIETLLRDASGQRLSSDEVAALSPGALIQADLVLSDTRADGQGLIGLQLDLQWDPQALELQQVVLDPSLPLFRSAGSLDAAAGTLTGLAAAALPTSGTGAVLGDAARDRFASLSFTVGRVGASGLDLQLTPTKLPTSQNLPLDPSQVLALGPDPEPMAVIRGVTSQAVVGEQRFLVEGLAADGRRWQQQLTLTIQNVNDAPVALEAPPLTALEDQPLQLDLSPWFRDDDLPVGDQLTYHLVGVQPDWLRFDADRGLLSGLPEQAQVGQWQLQVEARDRSGAAAQQTLLLAIEGVDDAPRWSGEELPLILLRQERAFTITLPGDLFTDQDPGDRLTYSLDLEGHGDLASWLQLDASNGNLSGVAPLTLSDPISLGLIATDTTGLSSRVDLQLHVVDHTFNRAPYVLGSGVQDRTIREGESIRFDLPELFRDDDRPIGDRLTFAVEAPAWLQFDSASGRVSGVADNEAVGTHRIIFRAEDLDGSTAVTNFLLTVDNVNQAPERLGPAREGRLLQTGSSLQLDLDTMFRDVDSIHGDWLNYTLRARSTSSLGMPDWLSWNSSTGALELDPGAGDRGLLSLQVTANDRSGASSTYQLDLGIVSADGVVEVNQALQPLRLRPGELKAVDLADAFRLLRSGSELNYTLELLRRSPEGTLTPLSAEQADWLTLVDRQSEPVQRQDRLTIEPVLRLRDSGERISVADLAGLEAGTDLELTLTVDDLRQATQAPGVIGLDLQLDLSGLSLSADNPADLREAISDALPLFRRIDVSSLSQGQLRFSAAGLPALGLGEALGDQPSERLFTLNLRLEDPAQPVRIDLSLIDEANGGLGLGLADGSDAAALLNLLDLSTTPQFDLRLAPSADDLGQYALRLWAEESGGDSVSQIVNLQVGSGVNSAPERVAAPQGFTLPDNVRQRLQLERLFRDADGDQLTYNLQISAADPEQERVLRDAIRLVQTAAGTSLDFTIPGLLEPMRGTLMLAASDGALQTQQTIQLLLNPRSELVPLYANPHHPSVRGGQAVGLSDLFAAPPLRLNDSADGTELVVRSEQALALRLSADYRRLSGLSVEQAAALEAGWRQGQDPLTQSIPVSALVQALPADTARFDLNWLEVVAPAQPTSAVAIELASRSTVLADPTGIRFGLAQSEWQRAVLVTSPAAAGPSAVTPASERYLAALLGSRGISLGSAAAVASLPLQASSALLAWRSQADFEAAMAGTLQDVRPVVALHVVGAPEAEYQVRDLSVLGRNDARFAGLDVSQSLAPGSRVAAAWDPLQFTIVKAADAAGLVDVDPGRAGTQVVLELDVSGAGLPEGYFNAYSKFVAPETLAAAQQQGLVLVDLDQRPITTAGWYDFTQRFDAGGNPTGDGARFVVETINGAARLSKIIYTFTDNAFGDNNLNVGVIDDPGMPIRLAAVPQAPQLPRIANQLQRAPLPELSTPASSVAPVVTPEAPPPLSAMQDPPASAEPAATASGGGETVVPTSVGPASPPQGNTTGSSGGSSSDSSRGQAARARIGGSAVSPAPDAAAETFRTGAVAPAPVGLDGRPANAALGLNGAGGADAANDLRFDASAASGAGRRLQQDGNAAAAARAAISSDAPIEVGQPRWSLALNQNNPLQGLFHQFADLVGDETTLVGLMMGMLVVPSGVERSLRSLLESGLGRTIQVQRRNPDLEAQWALQLRDASGQILGLRVRLQQGRLQLQPQASAVGGAVLLDGERGGTLWQLLSSLSHPGDLIEQIDRRLDALLRAPLEEGDLAWNGWLDQLDRQRLADHAELWARFDDLRQSVITAQEVDPGLADALMLMELLDCHVRLGGQLPWLTMPSAPEPL